MQGQLIKNDVNQGILPSHKQGAISRLLDVIQPAPMPPGRLPKGPSPTVQSTGARGEALR